MWAWVHIGGAKSEEGKCHTGMLTHLVDVPSPNQGDEVSQLLHIRQNSQQ